MMKVNKYILIGASILILALVVKIVVNEHSIREYKSQIDDLRKSINYSEIADSILGVQIDSIGTRFYIVKRDENGNVITYNDMMKTLEAQDHVIEIQDIVIRNAKNIYKFNYSVKDSCGVVTTKFWEKIDETKTEKPK